ncbi:MAG TPA: hypothetical protein VH638_12500 [Gemmatimonadaceae bacterium]|jgi:hypothetical protein
MATLWKLLKVVIALAVAIPLSIIALAITLGVLGALMGIAILTLKLAVAGLVVWGLFRLAGSLLCRSTSRRKRDEIRPLPPADPYYEAAMRDLDRHLGEVPR